MKKPNLVFLAIATVVTLLILFIVFRPTPSAFAADGTISDSLCGRRHMMPGASDVECTEACVKAGAKYVLVSANTIYTLDGDLSSVKPYAGKQVHIAGKLNGSSITIASISGK
jgi:hypothetical protein